MGWLDESEQVRPSRGCLGHVSGQATAGDHRGAFPYAAQNFERKVEFILPMKSEFPPLDRSVDSRQRGRIRSQGDMRRAGGGDAHGNIPRYAVETTT
jgi:hypothetical protein